MQSLSENEEEPLHCPSPPTFGELTDYKLVLLTAGPGCWLSHSRHWYLKDWVRGIALTVVLATCSAEKDLSVP